MGTVRVMNQATRFERADVMCPVPWCSAVADQPCKARTQHRLVVSELIHPERLIKQRAWEDANNIPDAKRRKYKSREKRRKIAGQRRTVRRKAR